jgi:hypothetical protein
VSATASDLAPQPKTDSLATPGPEDIEP